MIRDIGRKIAGRRFPLSALNPAYLTDGWVNRVKYELNLPRDK